MAEGHLMRLGRDRRCVVVIDDLDQIDHGSLALIQRLAVAGTPIIATVRSEGAADLGVLPFWKDGLLERHDLAADPHNTGQLVETFLGGPATPEVVEAVAALPGHPLFIRELIADGRATGAMHESDGVTVLDGQLTAARRVADLLAGRLATLDGPLLEALELASVAEPLALEAVGVAIDTAVVEELEASGFLVVSLVGSDDVVSVAHPLIGEVIRSSLTTMRERRHRASVCDAVLRTEKPRPVDLVRAVSWMIEAGQTPPHDPAVAAARHGLATFDGKSARLAIESVVDAGHADSPSLVMLGRSHLLEGELAMAVHALEAAESKATTDTERAAAASTHSEVLLFGLGDRGRAAAVLDDALANVVDIQARAQLISMIIVAAGIAGDWRPALDLGLTIVAEPELNDQARLSMLVMTTIAQAMSGQTEGLATALGEATALAKRHESSHPAARDQLLVTKMLNSITDGHLDEASALVQDRAAKVGDRAAMSPLLQTAGAQVALFRGDIGRAVSLADLSVTPRAGDPLGLNALLNAVAACAHALSGDRARSEHHHAAAVADARCGPRERAFLGRAAAHRLVLDGDVDAAVRECEEAADESGDNHAFAIHVIYDMVRFGHPEPAVEHLETRPQFRSTGLCGVYANHADALLQREAVLLRKVSDEFFKTGALLYAAEASAQAGRHAQGQDTAAQDITRAWELFGRCTSVWSSAMEAVPPVLTSRETEVARLAAGGPSTSDIAAQLFLSQRTIENHLQKIYGKLGINARSELAPLFA